MPLPVNPARHLREKVEPELNTGCWLWSGRVVAGGYGTFRVERRHKLAHRVSWELHRGPIPPGIVVCHRCDTPACVNPDHLFLGTQRDNVADMIAKGRDRQLRGEENGRAKLSADRVESIRRRYAEGGISQQMLADMHGVTQSMISKVVRRDYWKEAA